MTDTQHSKAYTAAQAEAQERSAAHRAGEAKLEELAQVADELHQLTRLNPHAGDDVLVKVRLNGATGGVEVKRTGDWLGRNPARLRVYVTGLLHDHPAALDQALRLLGKLGY